MIEEKLTAHTEYCIVTDAASDLDDCYLKDHPEVCVIPMSVIIDYQEYAYGPGGNLTLEHFYEMIKAGSLSSTSQINIGTYTDFFEKILIEGKDILYLCFSSGMSGMYHNAAVAAKELSEKYPERKIFCIDTLCAAPGEGFLVREAVRRKRNGVGLKELAQWVQENRQYVEHWFTVDDLKYLHRGGRVSTVSAVMGTALKIKPLLNITPEGTLQVAGKLRGTRQAMMTLLDQMEKHWTPNQSYLAAIVHAGCPKQADQLQQMAKQRFPEVITYQAQIGPVIGTHTGPGLLALVFWGNSRSQTAEQEEK